MSGIEIFKPMPLYVSESAVAKVKSLVEEEGNPDLKLRVFVTGGGCSGFQYGFSFDEDFKQFPCRCGAKNCAKYIVKSESRWRIKKAKYYKSHR